MVRYKVIEANSNSIVVRYYTDLVTEEYLAVQKNPDGTIARCRTDVNISLPIPTTESYINDLIKYSCMKEWLLAEEKLINNDPSVQSNNALIEKFKNKTGIL